jgi:hypothetical protein
MPRISRFLLGDWLKTNRMLKLKDDCGTSRFAAGYCDSQGASHFRHVSLADSRLKVIDDVKGFKKNAVLRWRLLPGDWHLERSNQGSDALLKLSNEVTIKISSNVRIKRCQLIQGWESLHYLEKTFVPVLEVEIYQAGSLTTEIQWSV